MEVEHMTKDEFFAFMPLLIYGIAVSELVMHWRDYLKSDRRYWPHLVTGILLLELAFLNFYYLYDILETLLEGYEYFLLRLLPPLIFLLTVSVYTPENHSNIKEYFQDKMSLIFGLLALYISFNAILEMGYDRLTLIRLVFIGLCILIAITKNLKIFWFFVALRVVLFIWNNFVSPIV